MSCHSLWIGSALGPVERACLRSVLRQGHSVTLWCYDRVDGIPDGVRVGAAEEIVPRERIVLHHRGSPSLFSNLFRYELQRRGLGTWLDCDVYLLRPLDLTSPYLLGYEAPGMVGSAILRMPTGSPLLPRLLTLFEEREVPYWLPLRSRLAASIRRLVTGRTGITHMPWGWAGPKAVTALLAKLHPAPEPLAPDIFYPVPWREADWIFDPAQRLEDMVTAQCVAIHLWNECIRDRKEEPAAPGSFFARLRHEGQ